MKKIFATLITFLLISGAGLAEERIGKWEEMPIYVYIEQNKNAYMMKRCFNDWESSSNRLVKFEYTTNEDDADIIVKFVDKVSGKAEHAVGLTYPYVDRKGYFQGARIEIAKYSDLSTIKLSNYELAKIMRHEIGHAIGLPHTNTPYAIMNPTTDKCLNITKDDLKALKAIYSE